MELSQSLRDLLPFKALSKETLKGIGLNNKNLKVVTKSSAFEDNAFSILVASSPQLNPTSEFISGEYRWFRSHIDSDKNGSMPISIEKIDGKVNPADISTKGKSKGSEYVAFIKLMCGW